MYFLSIILLYIIIFIISFYLFTLVRLQDWDVPTFGSKYFRKYKKILVTFPHPDDETMPIGGLVHKLATNNHNLTVLTLTKGEKGDELYKLPPKELGEVRHKEFIKVMKIFKIKHYGLWDEGDGQITEKYDSVKHKLREYISKNNFDLVITYEKMGVYGHRDHVAQSKMVQELSSELGFEALYVTIGRKMARLLNLKKYIKNLDLDNSHRISRPEFKIEIYRSLFAKYMAAKSYKSQKLSHKYPLWLSIFINPYEYFTTKYPK